jgi:hypothetical protein
VIGLDWSAAAIPVAALLVSSAALLVGAIGRKTDREATADKDYVFQLEKRLDLETKRNDRLEDQMADQNIEMPDVPGAIPPPA